MPSHPPTKIPQPFMSYYSSYGFSPRVGLYVIIQPLINPRGRLRDSLCAIVPVYNQFPQRSVTKFGFVSQSGAFLFEF